MNPSPAISKKQRNLDGQSAAPAQEPKITSAPPPLGDKTAPKPQGQGKWIRIALILGIAFYLVKTFRK